LSSSKTPRTKPFTLNGKLVGFRKDGRKLKGLKIKAGDASYRVKLPKSVRQTLPSGLAKGKPVQVLGIAKQKKNGKLKLKAAAVQVLATATASPGLDLDLGQTAAASPAAEDASLNGAIATAIAPADLKTETQKTKGQTKILICQKGSCWKKRNGKAVCDWLEHRLSDRGLRDDVIIKKTGCMDRCKSGPNLVVMPGKTRYSRVGRSDVDQLIDQHVATAEQGRSSNGAAKP